MISPLSFQAATAGTTIDDCKDGDNYCAANANGGLGGSHTVKGKEFYLLQGGMIAMAVTGGNMVTCIPFSYHFSHYLFIVGGASFIIGEIANADDDKQYRKMKLDSLKIDESKLSKPNGLVSSLEVDVQTAAIKAKLEDEMQAKKSMESRVKFARATALLYDLAAILAGVELGLSLFPIFTGFTPDALICPGLIGGLAFSGLAAVFGGVIGSYDQANGKLGIDQAVFMGMLTSLIATASILAIPAVVSAGGRIAYFGGAALIANEVVDGLEKRIDVVNQNIAKLQGLLQSWSAASNPGLAGLSEGPSIPEVSGGPGQGLTLSPQGPGAMATSTTPTIAGQTASSSPCAGSHSSGLIVSTSACSNPLKLNTNFPNINNPELSSMSQTAIEYSNALSSGDMQQANLKASSLMANAGRIKELKNQMYKTVNDKLKEKGEKPMDFDALAKARSNEIMAAMKNSALKSDLNAPSPLLANTSLGANGKNELSAAVGNGKMNVPRMEIPKFGLGSSSSSDNSSDPTGMSDEEKDMMAANYDRNKSDYMPNEDDSLFKVVSKTYVRNLDKILSRKKKLDEDAGNQQ